MANEVKTPIPARLYNAAVGGHVAGADDIIDDKTGMVVSELVGNKPATSEENPFNGMGVVILPMNIQEVEEDDATVQKNILTQEMLDSSNTKYVIKYDYILGEDINIPTDCVLEFDGGSINDDGNNVTIIGQNTGIQAPTKQIINTNVTLAGTWSSENAFIPQWFGAVGDGVHDDTSAVQKAIGYGRYVYFPYGTYLLTSKVSINDKWDFSTNRGFVFDGKAAKFLYTGNDYAFLISAVENATLNFGVIESTNGGNIELYSTGNYDYIQYVNINFDLMICNPNSKNVYSHTAPEMHGTMYGWIQEIHWYGGRLKGAAVNNFHITKGSNCWTFYHIGFESNDQNTDCVLFDATDGGIGQFAFIYCRHAENFRYFIKSIGSVNHIIVQDYFELDTYRILQSNQSENWVFISSRDEFTRLDNSASNTNFKSATLWGGIVIRDKNFDDIITPGDYILDTYLDVVSCSNYPIAEAGNLTVRNLSPYSDLSYRHIVQYYTTRSGKIFTRGFENNEFTRWKRIDTTELILVTQAQDFHNFTVGNYAFEDLNVLTNCSNLPTIDVATNPHWEQGVLYVEPLKYDNSCLIFRYVSWSGDILIMTNKNGTWSSWRQVSFV